MKPFRLFHSSLPNQENMQRIENCYKNIKDKIKKNTYILNFIESDEGWIAFSGTENQPDLLLTLSIMKTEGKYYLYADLDDEISWQEWDFDNQTEFENEIVKYISPLINHTIKTITEKKKHKYVKTSRYYFNIKTKKWILIDENIINSSALRLFIIKNSFKEEIKKYHL